MKFVIVFPSEFAVGMVFEPCLIWKIQNRNFWIPHSQNPNYLHSDFYDLLHKIYSMKTFKFNSTYLVAGDEIFINIFNRGIGTEEYLNGLVYDIIEMGYLPKICR
jgi:hypothetical protein